MKDKKAFDDFFAVALKGEGKTYNDHNWYSSSGLKGYVQGSYGKPYSLLKKPLSDYTIGEIMNFQSRGRDNVGQLWATGRYQIIPSTLKGIYQQAGLKTTDLYSPANQDKLGWQLLMNRTPIKNYLTGSVPDTTANLEKASLSMAQIWSSIGVPYFVNGKLKNQSYYPKDKATTKTEEIQASLRSYRQTLGGKVQEFINESGQAIKRNPFITILTISVVTFAGYNIINYFSKK
jgi:hypothetical protein